MHYRNIKLNSNDEEFRLIRLKEVVDDIYKIIPEEYITMIKKLKDEKGTLIIYWIESPAYSIKL